MVRIAAVAEENSSSRRDADQVPPVYSEVGNLNYITANDSTPWHAMPAASKHQIPPMYSDVIQTR